MKSTFWTPKNGNKDISSLASRPVGVSSVSVSRGNKKQMFDWKTWIKGFGITGAVVLVILGIVGSLFYVYVYKPGSALMADINGLQASGNEIASALQNRDLVTFEAGLDNFATELNNLRATRDANFSWAKDIKYFQLNEFYSDSDRFINAGLLSVEAGHETAKLMIPFADAAGLRVDPSQEVEVQEGLMEAFQSWVTIMPKIANDMDVVIGLMAKIGNELEPIDTTKYPEYIGNTAVREPVELIKNSLSKADDYGPDIKTALTVIPNLLAVGQAEQRYMVIMQNDKELRPTGGFWTNYATFKIKDAMLTSDFSSKDMYSIDDTLNIIDKTYDFGDAPAAYAKYLKVERLYARDTNTSPDFPTSVNTFMGLYNLAMRIDPYQIKPVRGIVLIDTYVVSELLGVTGPVVVNGATYDKDNIVLELERIASLEKAEQVNRKGVIGDIMESMLKNVFESDKNLWPKLVEKGVDLMVKKHIQAYIFDETAQGLLAKYNFAGRVNSPASGDFDYYVSTNLGGDKTNWFTSKEVTHKLTKENNRWVKEVTAKYTYTEPSGEYAPFVKRFRDYARLYVPLGSEVISVDGTEDGTTTATELDKTVISGYVELGPGETKEMKFKYYLPEGLVGTDYYELYIQKQSGIVSEVHNVDVMGKVETFTITTDKTLRVKL